MEAAGHQVWLYESKIDIGDSIVERINQGLEGMAYLVLCFSSSGMSPWVDREWMSTLARQLSGHSVKILPVLLSGGSAPVILTDIKYAKATKTINIILLNAGTIKTGKNTGKMKL